MPHPLAGVGSGMLMPPFSLPPGALITLVLNQWRLDLKFVDGWVGGWINVADNMPGLSSLTSDGGAGPPVCSIAASFCSFSISGCYLVQHSFILGVDLTRASAENLLPFVLRMPIPRPPKLISFKCKHLYVI